MVSVYLTFFVIGVLTTITEWKQIHCRKRKKIKYLFTYPIFMFTYMPINVAVVLRRKIEWKPIQHGGKGKTLSDIYAQDDEQVASVQQTKTKERV